MAHFGYILAFSRNLCRNFGNLRKKSFSGACWPGGSKIEAWSLQNRGPEPPKSRPGGFKIEARSLQNRAGSSPGVQDAIVQHFEGKTVKKGVRRHLWEGKMANMAPTWRPKRLQNQTQNPKKPMLENGTFSASIFAGFGRRLGRVFGRFFGSKMHAKSPDVFSV